MIPMPFSWKFFIRTDSSANSAILSCVSFFHILMEDAAAHQRPTRKRFNLAIARRWGVWVPGKGTGYPAPSPQIRTWRFPSSGSSVQALFTEPSTNQATPRLAHDYAALLAGSIPCQMHSTGIWWYSLWPQSASCSSSQQNVIPGFSFPTMGPLGIGSPPSRPVYLFRPSVLWSAKTSECPSQVCSLFTIRPWYLGFPRKHPDLPISRATLMNTCSGLRPRWCPDDSPLSQSGLLPSARSKVSAFIRQWRIYPMTTTIHISGLNTEPASLIPSGFGLPLPGLPSDFTADLLATL